MTSTTARRTPLRTLVLGIAALGLAACSAAGTGSDSDSDRARDLAAQLDDRLAQDGLPPVDVDTATTLYGTDGGVSCENVDGLQHQLSLAQFGNSSLHLRRVVLDPSVIAYDRAVIETYCPDRLQDYLDVVKDLDTDDTIPTD